MKAICDAATPSTDSTMELQVAAYECLNKVVSLYYDKIEKSMHLNTSFFLVISISHMVDQNSIDCNTMD